jgi:hypothetical protein
MTHRSQFIFSILFSFLTVSGAFAGDSTRIAVKSGPQIYFDYGKLLTIATDFETKYEFGIGYQLKNHFQPTFRYGMAKLEPSSAIQNGTYLSEGQYWRAGLNYVIPFDAVNSFYIGVNYGSSKFEDSGTYEVKSELWPTFTDSFERKDLEADWFEAVLGSEKTMLNGHVKLGGLFGVRFINSRSQFEFIDVYAIPGYGRTLDKTVPFVNVYVKYQF